ncbi:hypothetical protein K438DRAFT_1818880 [Mycena galopus ATCC 62051]|nr:hypothetical protein K438DRAFT_1818880 [Mycena galopus ATCC 62051]
MPVITMRNRCSRLSAFSPSCQRSIRGVTRGRVSIRTHWVCLLRRFRLRRIICFTMSMDTGGSMVMLMAGATRLRRRRSIRIRTRTMHTRSSSGTTEAAAAGSTAALSPPLHGCRPWPRAQMRTRISTSGTSSRLLYHHRRHLRRLLRPLPQCQCLCLFRVYSHLHPRRSRPSQNSRPLLNRNWLPRQNLLFPRSWLPPPRRRLRTERRPRQRNPSRSPSA